VAITWFLVNSRVIKSTHVFTAIALIPWVANNYTTAPSAFVRKSFTDTFAATLPVKLNVLATREAVCVLLNAIRTVLLLLAICDKVTFAFAADSQGALQTSVAHAITDNFNPVTLFAKFLPTCIAHLVI
jgi:hypothetical protein